MVRRRIFGPTEILWVALPLNVRHIIGVPVARIIRNYKFAQINRIIGRSVAAVRWINYTSLQQQRLMFQWKRSSIPTTSSTKGKIDQGVVYSFSNWPTITWVFGIRWTLGDHSHVHEAVRGARCYQFVSNIRWRFPVSFGSLTLASSEFKLTLVSRNGIQPNNIGAHIWSLRATLRVLMFECRMPIQWKS